MTWSIIVRLVVIVLCVQSTFTIRKLGRGVVVLSGWEGQKERGDRKLSPSSSFFKAEGCTVVVKRYEYKEMASRRAGQLRSDVLLPS